MASESSPYTAQINVTSQHIADQMCAAVEGGSNYWLESFFLETPDYSGPHWYANADFWDLPDYTIKAIEDEESDDEEHVRTRADMVKAIELMSKNSPQHFADMMSENGDATTGDVLMQYFVLGEIVYG